jgi:hypothetical protein
MKFGSKLIVEIPCLLISQYLSPPHHRSLNIKTWNVVSYLEVKTYIKMFGNKFLNKILGPKNSNVREQIAKREKALFIFRSYHIVRIVKYRKLGWSYSRNSRTDFGMGNFQKILSWKI